MNNNPNPNAKLWAGVLLAVLAMGAYLWMKSHDIDDAGFMVFVSPLVTYLLIGGKIEQETKDQNEKLDRIHRQTNGLLDKRYQEGVEEGRRRERRNRPGPDELL